MRLTQKLLGYLNRVFDKDPKSALAFRIQHTSGAFAWRVEDGLFIGTSAGVELFRFDLGAYTLRSLIDALASTPGVAISDIGPPDLLALSARVLIDSEGNQAAGSSRVFAFTSLLWAYMDALAFELAEAKDEVVRTIAQMNVSTADDTWAAEWGSFFGVVRKPGESLAAYAQRIVDDTIRIRGNNKGIEQAIFARFGQMSQVIDVTRYSAGFPLYGSGVLYNAAQKYDAATTPIYGLFKVVVGYDLLGGTSPTDFVSEVRSFLDGIRHAGTHLESVELGGSLLMETFTPPSDGTNIQQLSGALSLTETFTPPSELVTLSGALAALTETFTPPTEAASMSVSYTTLHDALRTHSGAVPYASGSALSESLS